MTHKSRHDDTLAHKARRHVAKVIIVSCVVILPIVYAVTYRDSLLAFYYSRFRGGDLLAIHKERIARLSAIRDSLCEYYNQFGDFPRSEVEWAQYESQLESLLASPSWSEFDYTVDFGAFDASQSIILVADPGTTWPGLRRRSEDHPSMRVLPHLFSDGTIGRRTGVTGEFIAWVKAYPCEEVKSESQKPRD